MPTLINTNKKKFLSLLENNKLLFNLFCVFLIILVFLNNAYFLSYGMNIILIIALVLAILRKDGFILMKDWSLPLALFYFYEVSRGYAYKVADFIGIEPLVKELIWVESHLFFFLDEIPTVTLQHLADPVLQSPKWFDYTLFLFYGIFFWYWIWTGLLFWLKKREYFKRYIYGLFVFSILCVVFFTILPTAPPWYASEIGEIPFVERVLWKFEYIEGLQINNVQEYGRNDFAALPSLHVGWAVFATAFLVKAFGSKMYVAWILPIGIAIATWYGAEHYVIDSMVGGVLAYIAFNISVNFQNIKKSFQRIKNNRSLNSI